VSKGSRILVCCAATDKARAGEVCERLASLGLNIEIDGLSNDAERDLEEGIESARFVLFFFSTRSAIEGEALGRHLMIAQRRAQQMPKDRVFIIPVRFDRCDVPEGVIHLQLIDLFRERGFSQIVEVIRGELSLFTDDRDDQVYKTIEIGGLTWLAENLNYEVKDSWWYDDEPTNGKYFGRLYTWEAAQTACPSGWHIPSVVEWEQLAASAGGSWDLVKSAAAYKALTEEGASFRAVLGGLRERRPVDGFYERHQNGTYWGGDAQSGIYQFIFGGKVGRLASFKVGSDALDNGYSLRCVKNLDHDSLL
jgi:uncharacterized protein (TIGR02145 family)